MQDTLMDTAGSLAAVLLYMPLLLLPGAALAGLSGVLGFARQTPASKVQLSLIAAFSLLPAFDSSIARFAGLQAALWVNLALAAVGGWVWLREAMPLAMRRGTALVLLLWLALVGYALFDLDWRGRLYPSLVTLDMVKHAATIAALANTGAPPADPFFARPVPSGYYYFFYSLGALAQVATHAAIGARAAFTGLVFWTGCALFALAAEVLRQCGWAAGPGQEGAGTGQGGPNRLLVALLAISALDIIPVVLIGASGLWVPTLGTWNEEVTPWLLSLIWVPHHVTALIADAFGFLVLADTVAPGRAAGGRRTVAAVLLAAVAFVSSVGASVWVSFGAVAAVALWLFTLAWERRWRAAAVVCACGLLALLIAAPHLHDLAADRSDTGVPLAWTVRAFKPFDEMVADPTWRRVGRLLLLPVNYTLEFGVFLFGTGLFLKHATRGDLVGRDAPRLLALSAVSGLLIATFLRSVILYNDLGWRVMLFPQLAMLVWSVVGFRRFLAGGWAGISARPPLVVLTLISLVAFGYASTLYGLIGLRFYGLLRTPEYVRRDDRDSRIHEQLRQAYGWLGAHTPPTEVVQQNPTPRRVLDFGLYGRNRTGVADADAILFGASRLAVNARILDLAPVFSAPLQPAEVRRRAAAAGVDALVVTAHDRIWPDRQGWVWTSRPVYASALVRVIPVAAVR